MTTGENSSGSKGVSQEVGDMEKIATDGFPILNFIDFNWDVVSPTELSGRFIVTAKTCQPFGVLHGGVTAFLAESLASWGAQVASNWARIAGIDLTVSHLLAVPIGDEVFVKATPLRVGKRVQVWDVKFTTPIKQSSSTAEPQAFATSAVARLTVLVGLPEPERGNDGNSKLMAIARKNNVELAPIVSKL